MAKNYSAEAIEKVHQEIKIRTYDDKYLNREEEKEILRIAIELKIDVDDALALIVSICREIGTVCERHIEETCKNLLQVYAKNDGKIDKKEFNDVVQVFLNKTNGKISELEAKKRLKHFIITNMWTVKEGGLFGSKWFSQEPSDPT